MAEEELTRCVVHNGDEAPCVENDSGTADFASDDAPCAVPSSVSTLKSPATRKRRKWGEWSGDQSEIHSSTLSSFVYCVSFLR